MNTTETTSFKEAKFKFQFQKLNPENPTPIRDTFMEAWDDMYKYVKAAIDNNEMSLMELEQALWISPIIPLMTIEPLMFYESRDLAIREFGWTQPK